MRSRGGFAASISLPIIAGLASTVPDLTGRADPDMLRLLTGYQSFGVEPVNTVAVEQACTQPAPGYAADQVATREGMPTKQPVGNVSDVTIPGSIGSMPARVHDPSRSAGPVPVILYFYGGGWITGTLGTCDSSCRILADQASAIMVSVQYDLGPEHRLPTARGDADKNDNWLLNNAAPLGGDPHRIAPLDLQDPRLNVASKSDLDGLPPSTIASARIDPLRSKDEAFPARLSATGVPMAQRTFPGVTREFFRMGAMVDQVHLAETFAAGRLEASFAAAAPVPPPIPLPSAPRHRRIARHVVSGT